MTILPNYHQFDGAQWDIGPIRNALAYQGVTAPHSGAAFSEALLFGISGGVIAGYFTFHYKGFDPWLHFLTRNTLDPMEHLLTRLGIPAAVRQTDKPDRATAHLDDALAAGKPALVWADMYGLPYNNMQGAPDVLGMFPVLVYGHDGATAYIADRARVPLTVTADELLAARGRTASNKYRLMTLGNPDSDRLITAVEAGILACAAYMLDDPPLKPMKGKFGLDAFTRWADLLASPKKDGWAQAYPGAALFAVLESGYRYINLWGTGGNGARDLYADFLDEAAVILGQPALKRVAESYRASAARWRDLNDALLPAEIPLLGEMRGLMDRDYDRFMTQGGTSLPERQAITARLDALRAEAKNAFPLTDAQAADLRDHLRTCVLAVQDAERTAALALRRAMG